MRFECLASVNSSSNPNLEYYAELIGNQFTKRLSEFSSGHFVRNILPVTYSDESVSMTL